MNNYYQQHYKAMAEGSSLPNTPRPEIHGRNSADEVARNVAFSSFLKVEVIEGHVAYNSFFGPFIARAGDQHVLPLPPSEILPHTRPPSEAQGSGVDPEESCPSSSDDKHGKRLQRMRTYSRTRIINESDEARDRRLVRMRNAERLRRIFETQEKREQRLERLRLAERKRRLEETQEARERRLLRLRNSERARRERETAEDREKRLSRMRDYSRMRWIRRKSLDKEPDVIIKAE